MRILFHAPGVVTHRPRMQLPHTIGVQPTNVTHLGGLLETQRLTGNRGNLIHAEAPARTMTKAPRESCYGNISALQAAYGDTYPQRIEALFDAVVVSMANFIRPNHDGAALFSALKPLAGRVKVIILGAGLQGTHPLSAMTQGNRDLLSFMNDDAAIFGVRGERTAEWLRDNGFGNCTVLGCPSLFSFPDSILSLDYGAAAAAGAKAHVMTAGHLNFHGKRLDRRGRALLAAFRDIRASYVMQDEFFSYPELLDLPGLYSEGRCEVSARAVNDYLAQRTGLDAPFERYFYFSDSGSWRQAARWHDVFIGDRFHGGVAALQAGVPAIFLAHDNRVAELTEYFDLPAMSAQAFAKAGLTRALSDTFTAEAEERMKATYRLRHAHYADVLGRQGITITSLPPSPATMPQGG